MKRALSLLALSALAACGGGGGGGGSGFPSTSSAPEAKVGKQVLPALKAPAVVYPNCFQAAQNHIACDLVPGAIGAAVPAGMFASFTNKTGQYLQIDQVDAYTAERQYWSEYCAYLGDLSDLTTEQKSAGKGEVGCATKSVGEDYAPIRWGTQTALLVAPGEMVMLNAHTEPASTNHTYSLAVSVQSSGVYAWRQPQTDKVWYCDGQNQSTDLVPWQNTTGRDLHLTGAAIYSETDSSSTPNTVSGAACIYVLTADGAQKYSNCDSALRTRGEVSFPTVTVSPGEFVAAQAVNACTAGRIWNWATWLRVW